MARQENVVRIRQTEPVAFLLICSNWPRLVKAIQISPSKNIGRNHQLIASHFRFAPDFVWIDVDQFDDEITIRAGHRLVPVSKAVTGAKSAGVPSPLTKSSKNLRTHAF